MDPLSILLAAANFVPTIAKYFNAGDTTQKIANEVGSVAQTITGAANPQDALAKLSQDKALQQQFQLAVMDKMQAWDKMYLDDLSNARERDVKLAQAGLRNKRADFLVGVAIVVIIALTMLVVWHSSLNEYVKGIVTLVLGRFLGYVDQIYAFEFGTTRSSQKKDDTINKLSA